MAARRKMIQLLFSVYRNEKRLLFILAGICLLSAIVFATVPFKNDISKMLPDGSESMRCYQTISDSAMFNKAPLLFTAENDTVFQSAGFAEKLETFAASLKKEKEIRRIDYKLMEQSPVEMVRTLVPYLPQYLPAPPWDADPFVKKCLHQFYLPSATGRSAMLEIDPSGLTGQLLMRLEEFRKVSNFSAEINTPYVVSPDKKHLLVILETASPPADPNGGRALLASVEEKLKSAGFIPGKDVRLLFPHRRAIANEQVLKKDIMMVTILSIIIFTLLTVFIYRCDPTTFLIPALPFLSAFLTAALMALCFRTPLFFVVGMGGIVISLALDYGIHIYGAMTDGRSYRSLHGILPPLFAATATSCTAFLLFLTSKTDAIRQLGFFSGTSLLISLFLMLFLLPPVFRKRKQKYHNEWLMQWDPAALSKAHPRAVAILWILLILGAAAALPLTRFYFDVRQFDLSPAEYDKDDVMISELFQSGQTPGMALFHGKTREEALAHAAQAKNIQGCFLPGRIIPTAEERTKNLASWRKINWKKFQDDVRTAAKKYGFKEDYFDPFLNTLQQGIQSPPSGIPGGFRSIADRILVESKSGEWNAAVLYKDTEEIRMKLAELPHSTIISRHYFPLIMARDIFFGIVALAIGGIVAVIVLTFCFFRSGKDTLLALIPVVSALLFTAALFALTGKRINIPVLTGGIILCGLAVDYGIFSIHAMKTGETKSIFRSVTLSALTTAAGGLTVAFTRHPMLRDAGLTLIAGILFAWFTALFLLPAIVKHARKAMLLCLIAIILAVTCGCRMAIPFEQETFPVLTASAASSAQLMPPVRAKKFQCSGSMVMDFKVFRMNTLFMAEWDGKTLQAAGFSPAGAKIFELKGNETALYSFYFIPMEKSPQKPEVIAKDLLTDLLRIFPVRYGDDRKFDGKKHVISRDTKQDLKYIFAGNDLKLIRAEGDDWEAGYYKYDGAFPVNFVYDRTGLTGYRLIFRLDTVIWK